MADVVPINSLGVASVASGLFGDVECVNDLIPGAEHIERRSRFQEDLWDLSGHPSWKDKTGARCRLDFKNISPRWRSTVKELVLFQINPDLALDRAPSAPMAQFWPRIQEPVKPVTAYGNLKILRHALRIVDGLNIIHFDEEVWEMIRVLLVQPFDVAEKQEGASLSPATGRARAQQLIALWQVTQINGQKLLGTVRPFGGRDTSELFGAKRRRNVVRPHEDVGNVLGFVAWFFDHVAENIVDHIEWWVEHSDKEAPLSRDDLFDAMLGLTSQLAEEHDGVLPGSLSPSGQVTLAAAPLARLLGVYDSNEAYLAGRWVKSQLGNTVTYSLVASPCPVPISEVPNFEGVRTPWAERLLPTKDELDIWQRRLVYYAMYYLSATVMLRDQQLAELSLDPLHTEEVTRPNGETYTRHVLRAHRTKNRRAPVPTEVVVNGRIAEIIALLRRLQALLNYTPRRSSHTGVQCLLDQRLATPFGKEVRVGNRGGVYLDSWFMCLVRDGAQELYERRVIARHLNDVSISMQKVRITCAQAYAVREHGQALAAAFGQWDTARVAAGYVGDVYRLITPVDREETIDIVREDTGRRLRFASRHREEYTGKGLARLDETIERNRDVIANPQPLSAARLKTLGKNNSNIEQGPLTMCVFNSQSALCGGNGKADFRLCFPGQCRNSVMSRSDRARYELMRRQHLALNSDVLRRAADKMRDANPEIAVEFAEVSDEELHEIVKAHLEDYIQAALEDLG